MFLLEEIGVEALMILATVTATAIFVWAAATMLVRWHRFQKSERVATVECDPAPVRAAMHTSRLAGPSL
jgi:hypothetical protein